MLCLLPGVAHAQPVDVVVDSTEITLKSAEGEKQTGKVTLLNISGSAVNLEAGIPNDPGCTVTPSPSSVLSGRRTEIALTLTGCDVEDGADITLSFTPPVNPNSYELKAVQAAAPKPKWPIMGVSFLAATALAILFVILEFTRARRYKVEHEEKPVPDPLPPYEPPPPPVPLPSPPASPPPPKATDGGPGRLEKGTYVYLVTVIDDDGEKLLGPHSKPLDLKKDDRSIALSRLPTVGEGVKRRIYRQRDGGEFRSVGEITDHAAQTYTDGWQLGWQTELEGLGTSWNFKDNWVNSVTVGSAAFIALLTASDVLKAVLGEEDKSALGLFAVTAGVSATLVGISPLIVKLVGKKAAVPTVGGMLLAASVTLVGSIGQVTAVTWQGAELISVEWIAVLIVLFGIAVGAIVLCYAWRTLWHYISTGREAAAKKSDTLIAATKLVDAITALAVANDGVGKALLSAADPEDKDKQELVVDAQEATQKQLKQVEAGQYEIQRYLDELAEVTADQPNALL
jgi:hypothetical protein